MQQDVNYIEHHKNVNLKMINDGLSHVHISLYNALFLLWNELYFPELLLVNRSEVMNWARIGSANTYTKTLKELEKWGYLKYNPSYNPLTPSTVEIYRSDKCSSKGTDKCSSKGTDNAGDTYNKTYKLLNEETIKLIEANASLINQHLENWIITHNTPKIKKEKKITNSADDIKEFYRLEISNNLEKPLIENYRGFVNYMFFTNGTNAPYQILKLKNQLTYTQYVELKNLEQELDSDLRVKIDSLENEYEKHKNKSSIYLTMLTWMKRK